MELDLGLFVHYHITRNLVYVGDDIRDGRVYEHNIAVIPGKHEFGGRYKSVYVVSNGPTLVDKLVDARVVGADARKEGRLHNVPDIDMFLAYLDGLSNQDGAQLRNSEEGTIRRAGILNLDIHNRPWNLFLPDDYFGNDEDGNTIPLYDEKEGWNVGGRTQNALVLAEEQPATHSYIITGTSYNGLIGKVVHLHEGGLAETFHLAYRPSWQGVFIDENNKLVGVHRTYRQTEGGPVIDQERMVVEKGYRLVDALTGSDHSLQESFPEPSVWQRFHAKVRTQISPICGAAYQRMSSLL